MSPKPCEKGNPCVWGKWTGSQVTCPFHRCQVQHVTIPGKQGEYAYDSLSGRLTPWVTVERKEPRPVDYLWDGVEPVRDGARKIVRG